MLMNVTTPPTSKAPRVFLLFAVTTLMGSGCGRENEEIGGSGLIEATEVVVSSEAAGRVKALHFKEGDYVREGDSLLTIDASRLELELATAHSSLNVYNQKLTTAIIQEEQAGRTKDFAEKERDRVAGLFKTGGATQKELDQFEYEFSQAVLAQQAASANLKTIRAEIEKLESDVNSIEREIRDCYPLSPVTGTIIEKLAEAGELLVKGKPMVRIATLDTVWVKIYLPAEDFASIRIGDSAKLDTESGGEPYSGVVEWTSSEAEFTPKNVQTKKARADLVYAVKILIANSDHRLKIGMPVYVTFVK